ncbi:MAG: hypothetical protein COV10_02685 [Candidatus Vogelbacteria bacterium CG10_big_fil_rev_8_21_14_0_10_51_16]|uniref:Uncharacterized protein n=1 Tax=Candidatus Vogelbacteria bacterium CG10_big_fil_rev_8_21_14_0_10_51_16 TaxID=1975045 RepID=A0A2H0REF0_9BACT|nr:MAG: hypothetical protein COV10_02685 [Candidatus Vogelbacteria bacterium CG10_big_fil_rev_8_21_14_0_10_51_16]
MLGQSLIGQKLIRRGRVFTVRAVDPYPTDRISPRHREILGCTPGRLVAVPYRGTNIPNITFGSSGVARITELELGDGRTITRPGQISEALGLLEAYREYTYTTPDRR